jgi:hypothetical protein
MEPSYTTRINSFLGLLLVSLFAGKRQETNMTFAYHEHFPKEDLYRAHWPCTSLRIFNSADVRNDGDHFDELLNVSYRLTTV